MKKYYLLNEEEKDRKLKKLIKLEEFNKSLEDNDWKEIKIELQRFISSERKKLK